MVSCIFCSNPNSFCINDQYLASNSTIKDEMECFFGYQIDGHLGSDDYLCEVCLKVVLILTDIKRRLLPFIFRKTDGITLKPINLRKTLELLEKIDDFSEYEINSAEALLDCKRVENVRKRRRRKRKNGSFSDTTSEYASTSNNPNRRITRSVSRASYAKTITSRPPSSCGSYESFIIPDSPVRTVNTGSNYHGPSDSKTNDTLCCDLSGLESFFHPCNVDACSFISFDIVLLSKHKEAKHHKLPLFPCQYCKNKFTDKDYLEFHMQTTHAQYSCPICKVEFYTSADLECHWKRHYNSAVLCKFCNKRYKDNKVLANHVNKMHANSFKKQRNFDEKIKKCVEDSVGQNISDSGSFQVRVLIQKNKVVDEVGDDKNEKI